MRGDNMAEDVCRQPHEEENTMTGQVECWCQTTARLTMSHTASQSNNSHANESSTDTATRRNAFARVMSDALGSLLLHSSDAELQMPEEPADKR